VQPPESILRICEQRGRFIVFRLFKNDFTQLFAMGFAVTAAVMAVVTQPGLL
jgi:hypothetical protein